MLLPSQPGCAPQTPTGYAISCGPEQLARYLALLRMAGSPHSLTASPEWERLEMTALAPPHARNVLRLRALSLALAGESQRSCAAWQDVARAALPGSSFAAEADMWRGRCARGTMPPA